MSEIEKAMNPLYRPGDTVEVRALKLDEFPQVGRFPFGPGLVHVLHTLDTLSDRDLYWVLNPTTLPVSRIMEYNVGTKKPDVPYYRYFLIDIDPLRDHDIATDEQWRAAYDVALPAKQWLQGRGWDQIVMASSGNGIHLLVPAGWIPANRENERLIEATQRAVSRQFSTDRVDIETFADAPRLVRAYGTLNRKVPQTATLKHRRSFIID